MQENRSEQPRDAAPLSLAEGLERSGLSIDRAYIGYLAMGGKLTAEEVARVFAGQLTPEPFEHNKLAAALNEHYVETGQDHPVDYRATPADGDPADGNPPPADP